MKTDLSKFACPRPECADFGARGKGNLRPHIRYGSGDWLQIRCRTCGRTFSERRSFPLYPVRLPPDQVVRILSQLGERQSIRAVAEKAEVDKMTVHNLVRAAEAKQKELRTWLKQDQKVRQDLVKSIVHFLGHRDELKRKNQFA